MSENNGFEISRRKALAGIGGIGVASAGAGLGTSAYFSDEESFENNTLTAGELDLKVDWQQTYNGPIPGSNGKVGEHAVNAYPDTMTEEGYGDGLQDLNGVRYSGAGELDPVFDAADVPACCDCEEGEYYVTYGGETHCIEPLSGNDPEDAYAKVGVRSEETDFQDNRRSTVFLWEDETESGDGNVYLFIVNDQIETETGGTATYRIEGAPEARWESGEWVVEDDDRGDSDDDYEDPNSSDGVAVGNWIWSGENTDGGVLGPVNNNGSQGNFALRLTPELNEKAAKHGPAQSDSFNWFNYSEDWGALTTLAVLDGEADNSITLENGIPESGEGVEQITIHSACGIDSGAELDTPAVFQSEYYPEQEHLVEFGDVKPGDEGEITFSLHLCDNPGYIWLKAANYYQDGGALTEPEAVAINETDGNISDPSDVEGVNDPGHLAENIDVTVWYDDDCDNEYDESGEMEIFDGTLAGLMGRFKAGEEENEEMIPLSANDAGVANDCFPAETGVCIGFKWEVSTEVENIIQGDEVGFDFGFYTEQCRHNDDAMNSTNTSE